MQSFVPNAAMDNFYTLSDTVRLYGQVMRLWLKLEACFPLNLHYVRYENVVTDFDEQVEQLLSFLEIPFEDSVNNFAASSRGKRISTPSYRQVSQPIYGHAVNRWQRYEEQMQRHLPQLLPFINKFGY